MYWLDNTYPLYLAPMARFTDLAFRQLCKEAGADVMVTEFVMADSLIRGGPEAWRAVDFSEEQRPMGVQIFGSIAGNMAEAAQRIEARLQPDFIDINCGCPADRIIDQNAGSSLLRDILALKGICQAVIQAVPDTPVTLKIRIGWDEDSIVADEVGQMAQDIGIRVLTIHGRTKEQGYRGEADWDVINRIAAKLSIPVIGNGDVRNCHDVARIQKESPVSGLMIGRAALGYPWLFKEIKHYLKTGEFLEAPDMAERWQTILRYADILLATQFINKSGDDIRWMRPKLKSLTKNMSGGRKLRAAIDQISTLDELRELSGKCLPDEHGIEHNDDS